MNLSHIKVLTVKRKQGTQVRNVRRQKLFNLTNDEMQKGYGREWLKAGILILVGGENTNCRET